MHAAVLDQDFVLICANDLDLVDYKALEYHAEQVSPKPKTDGDFERAYLRA
jgi:hypothetical protein